MRVLLFLCILVMATPALSQEYTSLTWPDLQTKLDFDDPFLKLSTEQLFLLSQVAKIREKEKRQDDSVTEEDLTKKRKLEEQLTAEGVDIDHLLSIRYEIAALRQKQKEAVNPALDGEKIVIGGYLLPLNYIDGLSTEFLLVPWVGACIHTPPPPKNNLIYLKSDEGIKITSRYMAVKVEGVISVQDSTSKLFLVDGSSDIVSGYTINKARIEDL